MGGLSVLTSLLSKEGTKWWLLLQDGQPFPDPSLGKADLYPHWAQWVSQRRFISRPLADSLDPNRRTRTLFFRLADFGQVETRRR